MRLFIFFNLTADLILLTLVACYIVPFIYLFIYLKRERCIFNIHGKFQEGYLNVEVIVFARCSKFRKYPLEYSTLLQDMG